MNGTVLALKDGKLGYKVRLNFYTNVGIVLLCCVMFEWGCSSPEASCTDGYSSQTINPNGRECTNDCECNNQRYEGYCFEGQFCVSLARTPCQRVDEQSECVLDDRLSIVVKQQCETRYKTCQPKGLEEKVWGNCVCIPCPEACPAGQTCIRGACRCPEPQTSCQGTCRNIQVDRKNCGACNKACEPNMDCIEGQCKPIACLENKSCTLVAQGTFRMGGPKATPEHEVTLTRSYLMWKTEVTQQQFESLMSYNPSSYRSCGPTCPVESVNWHEAIAFTNALSKQQGLPPCFDCKGKGRDVVCSLKKEYTTNEGRDYYLCRGWRLPTEAEWEYAARAGTTIHQPSETKSIAWYADNSDLRTHPAGQKKPNAWGLFDMLGNVIEFVYDDFGPYSTTPVSDPIQPHQGTGLHVVRGGSYVNPSSWQRFDLRTNVTKQRTERFPNFGFRPVRTFAD